ncbi:hypothetical protein C7974DRAFT_392147 [Boeremia exigua]|uniref:uncharacterized protein n=1 Tax=Boeremia exigua TaxID=749465 RepID=UPI001E8CA596|nr:uncharacterized protein C7974DRAFT_392147 [Boeremia exigua]KAH6633106.1 hypothetical protein C7974DRAFT_392147 [Boeremia exigua]
MTPRTRTSNRDADYKVYYSKKVPQQVRFPHRRKTVRRPEPAEQDVGKKRQMTFLPEKMKQRKIKDGDNSEETETDEEHTAQDAAADEAMASTPQNRSANKKRKESDIHEEYGESASMSVKRRIRTTAPKEERSRTLRRQSTMTQIADGRRPSTTADEPDFKPVRRRSRASWGGMGNTERDKKQRTLTQMVPGMGRLSKEELEELSSLDADLEDDDTNNNTVSQTLIEQGLLTINPPIRTPSSVQRSGDVENNQVQVQVQVQEETEHGVLAALRPGSPVIVQSVEMTEGVDEQDYQPTRFIEALTLGTRQSTRRTPAQQPSKKVGERRGSVKPRFSLLSTPEKRRVFEIPSSQSPVESILSTQVSPQKPKTSALREETSVTTIVAETPSKRRQVVFQEPTISPAPPAYLRKFASTIQDSEDEDESDLEYEVAEQDQMSISDHEYIGAETQAILHSIDLACAHESGNISSDEPESSEEVEEATVRQVPYKPSPELGESWAPVMYDDSGPGFESYQSSRLGTKSQLPQDANTSKESLPVIDQTHYISQLDLIRGTQAPTQTGDFPSTPPIRHHPDEDLPSTPMELMDESSDDEEAVAGPSRRRTLQRKILEPPSTLIHQSTDLDGEPVQVPRSPTTDRETQQSHSSKAEQQLQNEWLSYSQYVHARPPHSSSMHAAADSLSYNATSRLPKTEVLSSPTRIQHSQATTVDETTPKKNRTQRMVSANTTPHRSSKSQPLISPERPPSLFIPSSFPSPSRTAMGEWSSPIAARTQNFLGSSQALGSLENFSIPPPPPMEYD